MPRGRFRSFVRTCALLCVSAAIATGCRVDVGVDVDVDADGSGSLSVTVTADEEVVAAAGDLAGDLRVDDLAAAGWQVTPPAGTGAGGLQVVLRRDFANAAELTALLDSLDGDRGPLRSVSVSRYEDGSSVRFTVTGTGQVDGGLAAFGDPDLLAALGATPYADDLDARRLTPTDAVGITLRIDLPGSIERTGGTVLEDGSVTWQIPVDGSAVDLGTVASGAERGDAGWRIAASTLRVVFVGWVALASVTLVLLPVTRRGSPRRGRPEPPRPQPPPDGLEADPEGGPPDEPPRRPTFPLPNG